MKDRPLEDQHVGVMGIVVLHEPIIQEQLFIRSRSVITKELAMCCNGVMCDEFEG